LPDDTWLLDFEPEFSRVLSAAARDGNTLSPTLRQAWDQEHLQVMTRKDPLVARKAHVSVIAHITMEEIQRKLNDVEIANGFANRFLFAAVRRSQVLPTGGHPDDVRLKTLALQVHRRLTDARSFDRLLRTPNAEERWRQIYIAMANEHQSGLVDAVTARAEAQMLRLSIVYAVLDGSRKIEEDHVNAALAVWAFCRDSASMIFGEHVGYPLAAHLFKAIRDAGPTGLARGDMHAHLGRHAMSADIAAALEHLRREGKVIQEKVPTAGRTKEVWFAREFEVERRMETAPTDPLPTLPSLTSLERGRSKAGAPLTSHTSLSSQGDECDSDEHSRITDSSEELKRALEMNLPDFGSAKRIEPGEPTRSILTPQELLDDLPEDADDD
jgi:hypothetical protein